MLEYSNLNKKNGDRDLSKSRASLKSHPKICINRRSKNLFLLLLMGLTVAIVACGRVARPTYDEATDDGSMVASNTDCRLFIPQQLKNSITEFSWEGSCRDGYANGYGTISFNVDEFAYEGDVQNGHITGNGTMRDGNVLYEGDFVDGLPNGSGKLYLNRVKYYEGEFVNGKRKGYGTQYNDDGGVNLRGYWANGDFRDLELAKEACEKMAPAIMQECYGGGMFDGGKNPTTELVSFKQTRGGEVDEISFNLDFDGIFLYSGKRFDIVVKVIQPNGNVQIVKRNSVAEDYERDHGWFNGRTLRTVASILDAFND